MAIEAIQRVRDFFEERRDLALTRGRERFQVRDLAENESTTREDRERRKLRFDTLNTVARARKDQVASILPRYLAGEDTNSQTGEIPQDLIIGIVSVEGLLRAALSTNGRDPSVRQRYFKTVRQLLNSRDYFNYLASISTQRRSRFLASDRVTRFGITSDVILRKYPFLIEEAVIVAIKRPNSLESGSQGSVLIDNATNIIQSLTPGSIAGFKDAYGVDLKELYNRSLQIGLPQERRRRGLA
ncbi:MAG TPA: hypothetical protein VFQ63_02405 [Patescibacteria group bacterium]|nr:hypothetical protein [Patescibacteria group bacterium]